MTESIIQPEPCHGDFCMFDIMVKWIDSNKSSMLLSLQLFLLWGLRKRCYIVSCHHFVFLNSKTNVATNNDNKSISLFLFTDSLS